MAVDKLVDSTQLDADLTSVANAIRAKSGGSGSLAFPAGFVTEIGNISGGGVAPPVNAVAQFFVELTMPTQPTTSFTIDCSTLLTKLTSNRTYTYELALWRNDVVSATSFTRIGNMVHSWGRFATSSANCSELRVYSTNLAAMSGGSQLTSDDMRNNNSFSSGMLVITLKNLTAADITGEWKGVFTLLPPWEDEYTGEKATTCPTGFLSYV